MLRVSDSDSGEDRIFTYEDGLVSAILESGGELNTFRYDTSGNLIEQTANEPYCDDFSTDQIPEGTSTLVYGYSGNLLNSISTTDGSYTAEILYNLQNQLATFITVDNCAGPSGDAEEITITYDGLGAPQNIDIRSFVGPERFLLSHDDTTIVRDNLGRVSSIVERDLTDNTVSETRTRVYGDNGLPLSDEVVFDNQSSFLVFQNTTICLLYTSPSPRDGLLSRMPSSA